MTELTGVAGGTVGSAKRVGASGSFGGMNFEMEARSPTAGSALCETMEAEEEELDTAPITAVQMAVLPRVTVSVSPTAKPAVLPPSI